MDDKPIRFGVVKISRSNLNEWDHVQRVVQAGVRISVGPQTGPV